MKHRLAEWGIALLAGVQAAPSAAQALDLAGRVIAIADGDTITLLDTDKHQHRIRLDGIDAPEKAQAFGDRSRQSLRALAHDHAAVAHCSKTDKYGRRVCRVLIDGQDVGLEQVWSRSGAAWPGTSSGTRTSNRSSIGAPMQRQKPRRVRRGVACGAMPSLSRRGRFASKSERLRRASREVFRMLEEGLSVRLALVSAPPRTRALRVSAIGQGSLTSGG